MKKCKLCGWEANELSLENCSDDKCPLIGVFAKYPADEEDEDDDDVDIELY